MNNITQETKTTLLYITIAFSFSVLMRLIWIYQFSGTEAFMFNGEFMINTNDGYYYAEGARDILSGAKNLNSTSPIHSAPSILTAFFARILPFSFETIILYMPVFLGSLIVVPIILIAKRIHNLPMGLIAALLASVAWSYYNRTMVGYYDTDMLNIVLPMFLLWSIIWAVDTDKNIYLLIVAIDILIYRWWYPQSYSLEFAFFGLTLAYTLVFDRKNIFNYKLLTIMLFAMMGLDSYIRIILVLGTFYIFTQEKFNKYVYYVLAISVVMFFVSGGFDPIVGLLKAYLFKTSVTASDSGLKLHFFSVVQTVREAGHIPFETFANRISGHTITFFLACIGYLYLAYKHKIMLFALPMLGLGFLASVGGLRFTVYAVPILAFGIAFLITEVSLKMPTIKMKYLSMVLFTLAILYPNYKHIEGYKVPTVFNANEVKMLDDLKSKIKREDYIVSWWDYGFPLRYYADAKTLVDGAQHSGSANFPVSYVLMQPQEQAAKMARLAVEYQEEIFESNRTTSNIEQMTLDYGFKNTNDFLEALKGDIQLPKKTRDIYLYLPFKMLGISPTIKLFSNINLMNGEKGKTPLFFISRAYQEDKNKILLAQNIYIDKNNAVLHLGQQNIPIRRFVRTEYDSNMQLQKSINVLNTYSPINIVYMASYKMFLVVDEETYNSLYFQLMILENYDKNLFEKVRFDPNVKIYRLKV